MCVFERERERERERATWRICDKRESYIEKRERNRERLRERAKKKNL